MGWVNNAELGQLGLEFGLNLSLKDVPRGGGGIKSGNIAKFSFSWGLGCLVELVNSVLQTDQVVDGPNKKTNVILHLKHSIYL